MELTRIGRLVERRRREAGLTQAALDRDWRHSTFPLLHASRSVDDRVGVFPLYRGIRSDGEPLEKPRKQYRLLASGLDLRQSGLRGADPSREGNLENVSTPLSA